MPLIVITASYIINIAKLFMRNIMLISVQRI